MIGRGTPNGCKNDVTLLLAGRGGDVPLARASRILAAASRSLSLAVAEIALIEVANPSDLLDLTRRP